MTCKDETLMFFHVYFSAKPASVGFFAVFQVLQITVPTFILIGQ
jgi:hypothetical protein